MSLFPTIPNPVTSGAASVVPPSVRVLYLPDLLFAFENQDMVLTGDGDIQVADGFRAWVQVWADRLLVQAAAHPIYSRGYGVDHDLYMQAPTRAHAEAQYTARIRRVASRSRDTRTVRGFAYTWGNDGTCQLDLEIVAMTGEQVKMGVALSA